MRVVVRRNRSIIGSRFTKIENRYSYSNLELTMSSQATPNKSRTAAHLFPKKHKRTQQYNDDTVKYAIADVQSREPIPMCREILYATSDLIDCILVGQIFIFYLFMTVLTDIGDSGDSAIVSSLVPGGS